MAREEAFELVEQLWNAATAVFASRLTFVEAHPALAARGRATPRYRRRAARARRAVDERWNDVAVVELDDHVARVAAAAAALYRLRGADAVQLASAAVLGSAVVMVSRDEALRRVSLAAGLDVAP